MGLLSMTLNRPNNVCKLNKSIYGLKQSARCWNSRLNEFLTSSGYRRSAADECIYIKQIKNSNGKISFVILAVYFDDMLLVSNDIDFLNAEKKSLCDRFEMTDQGEVHYMSIKKDRQTRTMYISQQNYVKDILKRFGMEDCKLISTPMDNSAKFTNYLMRMSHLTQNYQQAICCVAYLSTATRPDNFVAVSALSR